MQVYEEYWATKPLNQISEMLRYAPKIARRWRKYINRTNLYERKCSYSGRVIACIYLSDYYFDYEWTIFSSDFSTSLTDHEKSVKEAKKSCDKALVKMGWKLLNE